MPGKKYRDFDARRFRRVGPVRGVAFDGLGEFLADGAGIGLGRVGGAHERPPFPDRIRRVEHQHDGRSRRHELGQAREERARPVHRVEAFGLRSRQLREAHAADREPFGLDALENPAGHAPGDGVRLDDGKCAFGHQNQIIRGRNCKWLIAHC